ncbi:MAG TPA: DUF3352 domain-containing protein [Gaiellaceae bacterium]|jgi:hypothetical protein|nr:DUF3352 domain-containing protein [Gaiellaceae bacterium]
MRARTTIATGLAIAAAALTAAGCGGGSSPASSDLGGAASIAPTDAVAFVALDTNVSSSQWQAVDGLLKKFPSQSDLLTTLQKSLEQHAKLSWSADVQPALGSELDLVALPAAGTPGKPQFVGLTQPSDQSKLDALLKKADAKIVSAQIGGWTAFSDSQAALDAMQNAGAKLADNNTYQAATGKLSADALVRAYANGTEAQQLLDSFGAQAQGQALGAAQVPFAWASADVVASGDGLRVTGYSRDASLAGGQPVPAQPYASSLADEIPSGAILVADFPVARGQIASALTPSGTTSPFEKLFGPNAITLASEIDTMLGGETALYVRPGLPVPEVTLVTQPTDTAAATSALADIVTALKKQLGAKAGGIGSLVGNLPIVHTVVGGQLVVSTSQQGLADFTSAGPKLSSDPSFTAATQASGMPAKTTGFLYLNVASALPLLQTVGPFLGLKLPATLQTDAGALRTFTAYGTRTGDEAGFTVFVQVH